MRVHFFPYPKDYRKEKKHKSTDPFSQVYYLSIFRWKGTSLLIVNTYNPFNYDCLCTTFGCNWQCIWNGTDIYESFVNLGIE